MFTAIAVPRESRIVLFETSKVIPALIPPTLLPPTNRMPPPPLTAVMEFEIVLPVKTTSPVTELCRPSPPSP